MKFLTSRRFHRVNYAASIGQIENRRVMGGDYRGADCDTLHSGAGLSDMGPLTTRDMLVMAWVK